MKTKYITWLDVEREVKRNYKFKNEGNIVTAIFCYSSGMEVEYCGSREKAIDELKSIFKSALIEANDEFSISLEINNENYQIELIESTNKKLINNVAYPLWQEHVYISDNSYK
ncbi:hypothetical protein, partial [Serratia sp. ASV30]|uniref:hypothetical protein n=1 Tax=Serratia sp. ASV30 TaxID=2795127 RepID=UPI0018EB58ED